MCNKMISYVISDIICNRMISDVLMRHMIFEYIFLTFNDTTISLFLVIPAKPMRLSVTNKTSDSATLNWESRFPMQIFPPGLTHKVMYQNQWDHKKNWKVRSIYCIISDIFYFFKIIHRFIVIKCTLQN